MMFKKDQSQPCCMLCASPCSFSWLVNMHHARMGSGRRSHRAGLILKEDWDTAGCHQEPTTCQGRKHPAHRARSWPLCRQL